MLGVSFHHKDTMRFLKTISVILDILILVPGVWSGNKWRVNITNPSPCVMRGESVDIGCSYEYPMGRTVSDVSWFSRDSEINLSKRLSNQGRIEYIGNKLHDCTLRINNTENSDATNYYFKFWTTGDSSQKSQEVSLSVTEPSARLTPSTVSEGTWVTLTCEASCKSSPNMFWFKNGQSTSWAGNARFQARIEDAGSYQCAFEGQETWKSEAVMLDVQYAPVNLSVEVSPPDSPAEGGSVNLTCSSDANPPVHNYTWYKRTPGSSSLVQVGSGGQVLVLASLQPSQSGLYVCHARNSLGENNSTEVLLHMDTIDIHLVILRVGIGIKVLAVLLLPLVMCWAWKQDSDMDKEEDSPDYVNISGSVCRRQGVISSADQNTRVAEEESNV